MNEAARILRAGGLVAFPTETVYGLGADATNQGAIERLNRVKGRPPGKPYSLHLHSIEQVREIVPEVPPVARRLMQKFWPGPLTIVVPMASQQTVGLRVPDHPVAQAFLRACLVPVAAPSANRSGDPPPAEARQVLEALNGLFDCLLDGGPATLAQESTVVEIVNGSVEIRRAGAISSEAIFSAARGREGNGRRE